MRKYLPFILISLSSSLLSVLIYSQFAPANRITWTNSEGEVKYTGLVDKLFSARSNSAFYSTAPTNFTDAAGVATPAVVNIRALLESGGTIWSGGSLTGSSGSGVIL